VVTIDLPPNVREATLEIDDLELDLLPGHLDPVEAESASGRDCKISGSTPARILKSAQCFAAIPAGAGLEVTGQADDATRKKLVEQHGC